MARVPHSVLITGAAGFVGERLVRRMLADERFATTRFTVADVSVADPHGALAADPRVNVVEGDLCEPEVLAAAIAEHPDAVAHLAGVLGGAAERDHALARRVNVDATLNLLEALRDAPGVPRVVYASSIAVFGPPLPERIDDDTRPEPVMTYGAQKLMIEAVIGQFSARGWIDGLALRLPGIVARPDADIRLRSAFLSTLFTACAAGDDFVVPAPESGTSWLLSVPACIDAIVHGVLLDAGALGRRRAFTIPALRVQLGDLVRALAEMLPQSRGRVRFEPDSDLTAQFAAQPELSTELADGLGFVHDGSIGRLIERALESTPGHAS
ncbi:NAD-dependent epimerase/dehydratase family protein [Humibacter sp.]|uniref:NAD-dependent epimerase/dehydratase family protein n=1 Tax=Humibacter sp. TaxID=1940291 RepID=UPI003F7DA813